MQASSWIESYCLVSLTSSYRGQYASETKKQDLPRHLHMATLRESKRSPEAEIYAKQLCLRIRIILEPFPRAVPTKPEQVKLNSTMNDLHLLIQSLSNWPGSERSIFNAMLCLLKWVPSPHPALNNVSLCVEEATLDLWEKLDDSFVGMPAQLLQPIDPVSAGGCSTADDSHGRSQGPTVIPAPPGDHQCCGRHGTRVSRYPGQKLLRALERSKAFVQLDLPSHSAAQHFRQTGRMRSSYLLTANVGCLEPR